MRVIGKRKEPELSAGVTAGSLRAAGQLGALLSAFGTDTFIPKGLYRFRGHEAANRQQLECIAQGLARRALGRL